MALAAYLQPTLLRSLSGLTRPADTLTIIRVAAGDQQLIEQYVATYCVLEAKLKDACVLFLRTVIASAGEDCYRTLLLPTGASASEVKTHSRWLLKWLHPDLNKSAWESVLFLRVRQAEKYLEMSFKKNPPQFLAAATENQIEKIKKPGHRNIGMRRKIELRKVRVHKNAFVKKITIWMLKKRRLAAVAFIGLFVGAIYLMLSNGHDSLQELWITVFG